MPRYLWHLDAGGWPLERINRETGHQVPVFTGRPDEWGARQDGGRPIACSIPKVSGVEWVFGGDGHPAEGKACGRVNLHCWCQRRVLIQI